MPAITKLSLGAFCRELALQLEPFPDLLKSWNLTDVDYEALRKSEAFRKEMVNAVEEIRTVGGDAGFIYRCKIIAEDSIGEMVRILNDTTVSPAVRVELFDKFTDLARLKPTKALPALQNSGQGGPTVTFVFGEGIKDIPATMTVTPTIEQIEEKPEVVND